MTKRLVFNASWKSFLDKEFCLLIIQIGVKCHYSENHRLFGGFTFPKTNIARENWGLEDDFPFGKASL